MKNKIKSYIALRRELSKGSVGYHSFPEPGISGGNPENPDDLFVQPGPPPSVVSPPSLLSPTHVLHEDVETDNPLCDQSNPDNFEWPEYVSNVEPAGSPSYQCNGIFFWVDHHGHIWAKDGDLVFHFTGFIGYRWYPGRGFMVRCWEGEMGGIPDLQDLLSIDPELPHAQDYQLLLVEIYNNRIPCLVPYDGPPITIKPVVYVEEVIDADSFIRWLRENGLFGS